MSLNGKSNQVLPGVVKVSSESRAMLLNCGSWTGSISSIWELVRNADSWADSQKLWGWDPEIYVSTGWLGDCVVCSSVRSTASGADPVDSGALP